MQFELSLSQGVWLNDNQSLPVCLVPYSAPLFVLQDLYLHQFFQHCQLMKSTSEGNPAELVKYLKVSYRIGFFFRSSNNYQQCFNMTDYHLGCICFSHKSDQVLHHCFVSKSDLDCLPLFSQLGCTYILYSHTPDFTRMYNVKFHSSLTSLNATDFIVLATRGWPFQKHNYTYTVMVATIFGKRWMLLVTQVSYCACGSHHSRRLFTWGPGGSHIWNTLVTTMLGMHQNHFLFF